jgi:nicotinate-nucleotide adenylyltransferase
LIAIRALRLDAVWWLVSPQNPLKQASDMAPLSHRLSQARATARHPRIEVTGLEANLGTRYTVDTVAALQKRFPTTRFVWLMGADNLIQIPRWARWTELFERVPVAVFTRPSYSLRAAASLAAQRYAGARLRMEASGCLATSRPPAWVFFHVRRHLASATAIRELARRSPSRTDKPTVRNKAITNTNPETVRNLATSAASEGADVVIRSTHADRMSGAPLLTAILTSLEDDQAEDIVAIDLTGKSSMCDTMVVASGRSQRQVLAMAEHLREVLKARNPTAPAIEGLPHGDWVLVDGGDVIVHLFRPEVRTFYGLEKMWGGDLSATIPADSGEA